jgi:hypothetical protein
MGWPYFGVSITANICSDAETLNKLPQLKIKGYTRNVRLSSREMIFM